MGCRTRIEWDHISFFPGNLLFAESFYLFLFEKSIPLSTLWTLAWPLELSMMTVGARKHDTIIERYRVKDRGRMYKYCILYLSLFLSLRQKKLDSKSNFHIQEIPYKSSYNGGSRSRPDILKCEKMYQSKSNKENNNKRIKSDSEESHVSMTKLCWAMKCPLPICEKSNNWFENKGNRKSKKIVDIPKSNKIPNNQEIKDEHDSSYQNIAEELYDVLILLSKMKEVLRHA